MKFIVSVTVNVTAKGSGLSKEDLEPLVDESVAQALEDALHDVLYDAIASETEKENWDSLEVESYVT